jgi:hypothetical protein
VLARISSVGRFEAERGACIACQIDSGKAVGLTRQIAERLDSAMATAEVADEKADRVRITPGLVALAGRERDMIHEAFRDQLISARLAEAMLSDADRLIERTREGGRDEYRAADRLSLAQGPLYRFAIVLHNRLRLSGLLARMTTDRFAILLNQRLILRDLHGYIDANIRRMREDVARGRPMIAALGISRADDLPRQGFFDLAVALGRFPEDPRQHRAAWQAECAAVFGTQADASS